MATLLLAAAGGALGGVFGPLGAIVGQAAGALAGGFLDQALISSMSPAQRQEGPRLTTTDIQTSTEGAVMDRVYGRARVSGQIIWATRFEEQVITETTGGKGSRKPKVTTTTYSYFANFAVGLCEGPIAGIGRIWADGKEIDRTLIEHRPYSGSGLEAVDPLIEAKEGLAPAYRGTAYIVFERLALEEWGNRIPQISVEVWRPTGYLEQIVQGVTLIGGNEFGYDTALVRQTGEGGGPAENRHTLTADVDLNAALDQLRVLAPAVASVMLVVPWMGDDLRCGSCTIRPKVDSATKTTTTTWRVSNLTRSTAQVVSSAGAGPAYGGSPHDGSVIRCIQALRARGYYVTVCPFIMMDVPFLNALPSPYSDFGATAPQPSYPWRGRITCTPAAGFAGSVDQSPTAAAQVAAFVGGAVLGNFAVAGDTVAYSGPDEWSYRRFILHNAMLAAAGGANAFLVGSEMIGMTRVRSSRAAYPFVDALRSLAAEVAGFFAGAIEVGYAADWTEYNAHRPADGSGDVWFNLDPLWGDASIDFVGIDNYFPLSDWRDGSSHLDFDVFAAPSIYTIPYLAGNVEGGEGYDWFYASPAARDAQTRTPIVDSAYGKHWVFRPKDVRGWWSNPHYNRLGGVEDGITTAWTPQGKPLRYIEMGCPAVDKGSNQPNVFVDPKSSESFYPYYSAQVRDDVMQRCYLEALIGYYLDPAHNPVSGVYGGRMLDLPHSHVWTWDARPWPSWPQDGRWGDAGNWWQGHWLTGRLGSAPGRDTIRQILTEAGFSDHAIETLPHACDGVTTGSLGSARAMLEAIRPGYQFDAVESSGSVRFLSRAARAPLATIAGDDLVIDGDASRWRQTRAQETDLPRAVKLRFGDPYRDDQPASIEARRATGGSQRTLDLSVPMILADSFATTIAERELRAAWVGRERAEFGLPPSRLAFDPGDVLVFAPTGQLMRLSEIGDGAARRAQAFRVDPAVAAAVEAGRTAPRVPPVTIHLPAGVVFIDAPLLRDDDVDHAAYVAASMAPFGAGVALYRSPASSGFAFDSLLAAAGTIGVTTADFYPGPVGRFDTVNSLYLRLLHGALYSIDDLQLLNGGNVLLVQAPDNGEWEVLQFGIATPNGTGNWILSRLLRGQQGSEHAMRSPLAAGARVVFADLAIQQTALPAAMVGLPLNWRYGPAERDVGAAEFRQSTVTLRAKARRPLSPVHLRADKKADDDFALSWIRRTRIGGDSWDQVDVPLGEESERYDVEILDAAGTAVLRTIGGLSSPATVYTAAQQTADFGGPQATLKWRVYQRSATYGRGMPGVYG